MVSSSHIVSAVCSSSGGEDSSLSALAPVWGPLHRRQFSLSCSNVSPSHGLQLFTSCSSVGHPWGHKPCQQPCSGMGSSLHRSCQQPAPAWAPHWVTASFGHPPAPAWGSPWAAGGDLLRGLQGHSLPHHALLHGLQGNLLWSLEHLLPLLLHWPWCLQSCFSHIFSFLLSAAKCCYAGFFPLPNYVIPEALPGSLMGSALASSGSVLELAGIGSVRHREAGLWCNAKQYGE